MELCEAVAILRPRVSKQRNSLSELICPKLLIKGNFTLGSKIPCKGCKEGLKGVG